MQLFVLNTQVECSGQILYESYCSYHSEHRLLLSAKCRRYSVLGHCFVQSNEALTVRMGRRSLILTAYLALENCNSPLSN